MKIEANIKRSNLDVCVSDVWRLHCPLTFTELTAISVHEHARAFREATAHFLTCIRWNSSSERACDTAMFTWEAS